jgi:TPR repeat protein
VPKDPVEAARWLRLAAEAGDSGGQHNFGYLYANGLGVEKDPEQAFFWYQRAAEQGHGLSRAKLGLGYWVGDGTEQDLIRAYMWFELGRIGGDPDTEEALERIAEMLTDEQMAEALRLVEEWRVQHGETTAGS